jgi:hypothetical protein
VGVKKMADLDPKFIKKTKKFDGLVYKAVYFSVSRNPSMMRASKCRSQGYRTRVVPGEVSVPYHGFKYGKRTVGRERMKAYIVYVRRK